jgi:uncharacterized beta-barrel protein YwiB (DUF1934 family)
LKITVKTTIVQEDHKEIMESTATGEFFQKENASYLQYEESSDQGSIRTTVKVAGNEALILRNGAVKMRLPFALYQPMRGTYKLPFGKFETMTLAKNISLSKGKIDLLYDFSMQGAPSVGTYHLEITFQEEEE